MKQTVISESAQIQALEIRLTKMEKIQKQQQQEIRRLIAKVNRTYHSIHRNSTDINNLSARLGK